jgi:hypothetical protein
MLILFFKYLGAPLLIALASLAGKRFGPAAAGLLSGLPVIAGPIILALWLEHGTAYAVEVAWMLPVGMMPLAAYLGVLVWLVQRRRHWAIGLCAGWLAFLITGAACLALPLPYLVLALAGIGLMLGVGLLMPVPQKASLAVLPHTEIAARMLAAMTLVATVTTISQQIGTGWTGILAAFPVAGSVMPAFTLARSGPEATLVLLRGFISGLLGLAACFVVLALLLPQYGGWAFLAGFASSALVATLLAQLLPRRSLR